MNAFLQFALSGVAVGSIYALVALGFTLIYDSSGVINVAQGEFVMAGGMITASLFAAGVPLYVAAVVAVLLVAILGFALHRFAIAPANADPVVLIIITIGASLLFQGVAQAILGKQMLQFPAFSGEQPIYVFGATIVPQVVWMFAGAIVVFALLHLYRSRTLSGQAMRATSANLLAARLVGINTTRIITFAFVASAAVGAIAGVLMTPMTLTRYDMGILLAIKGFAGAMLGGMGNPMGALVGGFLVGLLESFGAGYISSKYKDAVAFLALIAVLMFMPSGLFGKTQSERV